MTRDYNTTAMNKTSKSKPYPSETGNLTELQRVTFLCLCPHHPTNQTPKSEMKPPQSPFRRRDPLPHTHPSLELSSPLLPAHKCITLRTPGFSGRGHPSGQDGSPEGMAGPILPCPRPGPTRENGSSLTSGSSARSSLPWNTACPDTKAPAGKAARGATIDTVQATVLLNQTGWTERHSNRGQRKRTAPSSP